MNKLKLSELNLGGAEVLTREQLKQIKGGVVAPIYCTYEYQTGDGEPFINQVPCAASMDQCNQDVINQCLEDAKLTSGCCNSASCTDQGWS